MGQVTPNMGIYIPAAGETNYDAPFAAGMINIDQHDHSGAPNKGVPIATSGIADGSITYQKLASNVVDTTSGLGTHTGGLANQITTTGLLNALATLASITNGLLAKNGTSVNARTITGTANQVTVTNGDGVSGNPVLSLPSAIYTNISFDSGSNILNSYTTGTFSPQLTFGGASVGLTTSLSTGKYWKVGNLVFINILIDLTNKGSSTGAAVITGLPFTSANDGFFNVLSDLSNIQSYPSGCTFLSHEINPNTSAVVLAGAGAANRAGLTNSNFSNTDEIQLSGFYWIA